MPEIYERELTAIIEEVDRGEVFDRASLEAVLRRYPKDGCGFFSKSEIIRGFRYLRQKHGWAMDDGALVEKLRMKPIRTMSGVAPVTVLTKPYPCPGRCIFCPSDVRMPKSYLSDEPGAQRAGEHQFDPYGQTLSRLLSFHNTGHCVDKIELIVLGGTWSFYPEPYQLWFVKRCFDAMNDFDSDEWRDWCELRGRREPPAVDFRELVGQLDGRSLLRSYNEVVTEYVQRHPRASLEEEEQRASWRDLETVQRRNETATARCVGLVVETRPDHLSEDEVRRIRRLGATKVQIGYQSLSDEVLSKNKRGHDVAATRRAMQLLRHAGFKIHAHWMPNLYGSSPERDVEDFDRMFAEADFRPDELKIYPCSLIESAELMSYYEAGEWRPYSHEELLEVLTECFRRAPPYCRLTRVIRDIPGTDIVAGNKVTNFRQIVERELERRGWRCQDIRSREVRELNIAAEELSLEEVDYRTSIGRENFLQYVTPEKRLAGFLRLSLPRDPSFIPELAGSAVIREVHVYGSMVAIGARDDEKAQHLGLGRRLIRHATMMTRQAGYRNLAVISSVGTREYYRQLGFCDGDLYQHRPTNR